MCPGPAAVVIVNGIPPNIRLKPPPVFSMPSEMLSSFHSSAGCSKNRLSPAASLTGIAGTISPSSSQLEFEKPNVVVSRIRGAERQPDSVTTSLTSSGAPHVSQLVAPTGFCELHQL